MKLRRSIHRNQERALVAGAAAVHGHASHWRHSHREQTARGGRTRHCQVALTATEGRRCVSDHRASSVRGQDREEARTGELNRWPDHLDGEAAQVCGAAKIVGEAVNHGKADGKLAARRRDAFHRHRAGAIAGHGADVENHWHPRRTRRFGHDVRRAEQRNKHRLDDLCDVGHAAVTLDGERHGFRPGGAEADAGGVALRGRGRRRVGAEVPRERRAIRRAAGVSEVINQPGLRDRVARAEGGLRLGTVANGVRGGDGDDRRVAVEVNGGGIEENRAFAGK